MGVQIVIFLAFTSVTLVFNSLVIWFAYKAFADITLRVTGTIRDIQATEGTRRWVQALETASVQAVAITEATRDRIQAFEPVLATAQSKYGYGLAKVDIRVESFCENVIRHTSTVQRVVEEPCRGIGVAMTMVQDLLEQVTGATSPQSGGDAIATPSK